MADTTNLKISGMTCNHCVNRAQKALEGVAGVDAVNIDLEQCAATVDGNADSEKMIAAVKAAGYQAELV